MSDIHALVTQERLIVANMLDTLNESQWNSPSLCTGWTVRNVAAHLVMPLEVGLGSFMLRMLKYRFDFNRLADAAAREDTRSGAELSAVIRANADHKFKPPGFGYEAPLTDSYVHGNDIRRALGLERPDTGPEQETVILNFLATPKAAKAFGGVGLIDGLQVSATDIDWSHGSGPAVTGTAAALILTLTGRPAALNELSGEGATTISQRLTQRS